MRIRSLAVVGLMLPFVLLGAPTGAQASASKPAKKLTVAYECQQARENLESLPLPGRVKVELRLDLPKAIEAGGRLKPGGVLTMEFPETSRQMFALSARGVEVQASSLGIEIAAGSQRIDLATSWTSQVAPTSVGPLVATGPLKLPAYTVPEVDELSLSLPATNDTSPLIGTGMVAFNLEVTGSGGLLGETTYFLSCAAPSGAAPVNRVRVEQPEVVAPETPTSPEVAPGVTPDSGPPPSTGLPGAPAAPVEPLPEAAPPAVETPPVATAQPTTPAPVVSVDDWALASAPDEGGYAISAGRLFLITLVIVLACMAWSVVSLMRVRSLRSQLGERGGAA